MSSPIARPRVALAMYPGLERAAFGRAHRARLEAAAEILDWAPIGSWDDPRAAELLAEATVLLTHWGCPTIDAETVDRAPQLTLVAHGAGTVKGEGLAILTREVLERGITVTSCAPANAVPVAEYALAAILWSNKDVFGARERQRGATGPPGWAERPRRLGNVGRRIGLVGASAVGRHLIGLLAPFDLDVSVYDPYLSTADADRLGVHLVDDLLELCRTSEVLSLHAPLLESTRHMIGAEQLAALPDGATVINTARGGILDHDALLAEVTAGRLDAVLDVTEPEPLPADSPLLQLPNVIVTPHVAGSQGTELTRMADLVVEEVERFATGERPLHPVTLEAWDRLA